MDSRSKKGIGAVALLFILLGVVFFGTILWLDGRIQKISNEQETELLAFYPEASEAIHDNFSFYQSEMERMLAFSGMALFFFVMAVSGLICFMMKKETERRHRMEKQNEEDLTEQLELFKKNGYQVKKELFEKGLPFERREYWERLEESLRELGFYFEDLKCELAEEENSTKELITNISHQLKTPLASLKMCYELSREQELTGEERAEFAEKEKQEILKLESLLGELVKLSRLENHMIQVEKKETELKKILTAAVNQLLPKAKQKHIEFQAEIAEEIFVAADEKWTVEAFVNVLDNAVKYSKEYDRVLICVKKTVNLAVVEIEDSGIGIPAEDLHKIFMRFYRGKEAAALEREGAGVGLYLTRMILEELGGTITAKRKEQGTIFCITLPF